MTYKYRRFDRQRIDKRNNVIRQIAIPISTHGRARSAMPASIGQDHVEVGPSTRHRQQAGSISDQTVQGNKRRLVTARPAIVNIYSVGLAHITEPGALL